MNAASRCARARRLFIGHGAPAIAVLMHVFYWLLFLYGPQGAYRALLHGLGVDILPHPFLDLRSVLQAIDCARQGVDVIVPNACMGGGLFQYSPLLLDAAVLPLRADLYVPLGLALDALFLLSLFALPRPRRWNEFWQLLLAALSSSTLFAMERANIDIGIYLIAFAGMHLLLRGPGARLVGYALFLGAAATKFYPAPLMVLAAWERPTRFLAITVVSCAAAMLLAVSFSGELGPIVAQLPQGNRINGIFSASTMPLVLASLVNANDSGHGFGLFMLAGSTACLIGIGALLVRRWVPVILPDIRALSSRERILLVGGSALTAFCFFAARNNYYREIFLILTLPGFWALGRRTEGRVAPARFRFAAWVVVLLLWSGFVWVWLARASTAWLVAFGVWALRELSWWWLASLFVSITLCFVWDAPIVRQLRRQHAAT